MALGGIEFGVSEKKARPRVSSRPDDGAPESVDAAFGPPWRVRTEVQKIAGVDMIDSMIPPQVHLRRPCYDFSFL